MTRDELRQEMDSRQEAEEQLEDLVVLTEEAACT